MKTSFLRLSYVLALGLIICLPGRTWAYTETFNDATLIQPVNQTSWENVFGDVNHYDLKSIAVTWSGSNVTIAIRTNDNGTPAFSVDYIADLAIDKNRDGIWETGIILKSDARRGTTLPGAQAGTAGTVFTLAGAIDNKHWYRTNQAPFSNATSRDYTMYYDRNNGIGTRNKKRIPVLLRANSSYKTFAGSVNWTHLSDYLVTITLAGINTDGSWNSFNLLWGTETCGNDVQYNQFNNVHTPIPSSALLLGTGLLGLFYLRRSFLYRKGHEGQECCGKEGVHG